MRRTILISGTSKGIGRALANRLVEQGHRVVGVALEHRAVPLRRDRVGHRHLVLAAVTQHQDDVLTLVTPGWVRPEFGERDGDFQVAVVVVVPIHWIVGRERRGHRRHNYASSVGAERRWLPARILELYPLEALG